MARRQMLDELESTFLRTVADDIKVGDTVEVGVKIKEGEKERIQVYGGIVISIRGTGTRKSFTVRRIVQGEGVERTFPFHSPKIASVNVKRRGNVRRAKLYYLRERVGKATKVKERIRSKDELAREAAKKGKPKAAPSLPDESAKAAAPGTEETKAATEV